VGWLHILVTAASGIAAMRAAIDRGDVDEAARQGALAGPAVIEQALAAPDRSARLAGIAAAPLAEDRAELLEPLARVAGGPDRRVAVPAAAAARAIARELARRDRPDDIAGEDVGGWRDAWLALARRRDRWIEVRVLALDVAIALDPAALDLGWALAEPDPALRRAAIAELPLPVPDALRPALGAAVVKDIDPDVALAAAAMLCGDLSGAPPKPILDALGPSGLARLKTLVTQKAPAYVLRDAKRCLGAR